MPTNNTRGLWRGKRLNNGEWVLGCLIRSSSKAMIFVLDDKTNRISGTDVDPSTLGECMGAPDKNDKLIFEGDIIKTKYGYETVIGVVVYGKYIGAFILDDGVYGYVFGSDILREKCEIIGNIHDNPELLKGAENS